MIRRSHDAAPPATADRVAAGDRAGAADELERHLQDAEDETTAAFEG